MPTVLKNDIHANIASIVYEGIRTNTTRAFFFLGRPLPWEGDGDQLAPIPTADRKFEYETRQGIIGMRPITSTDVSFVIPREDWKSGTIYDMYDTRYSASFPAPSLAEDIADAKMFVVTDEYNIYKCISNNYGKPSTVKPTGTDTDYIGPFEDGYIWKYMATIGLIPRSKFATSEYIPVEKAVAGRYLTQRIELGSFTGGQGYQSEHTYVTVSGNAGAFGAEISLTIDESNGPGDPGTITAVTILNPGENYTSATANINQDEGFVTGTGGSITLDLNEGDVTSTQAGVELGAVDGDISFVYVNDGGSGYSNQTTLTIVGNGVNGACTPVIDPETGTITSVTITDHGEKYTQAEVQIYDPLGTGSGASIDVIISPVGGHGRNIIEESYASILGFQVSTENDSNQGVALRNDYRQSGLIFYPRKYVVADETQLPVYSEGSCCFLLNVESQSLSKQDFELDEILYESATRTPYNIVAVEDLKDGSSNVIGVKLLVQQADDIPPEAGDVLLRDDLTTIAVTVGSNEGDIVYPQIDKFSGSMVFINNRTPFRKSAAQIVNLRTFIKF